MVSLGRWGLNGWLLLVVCGINCMFVNGGSRK